eukprot:5185442-Ditylum_brightwellii.AAC.1
MGLTPVDLIWKRFVSPEAYRSPDVKSAAEHLHGLMKDVFIDDLEQDTKWPVSATKTKKRRKQTTAEYEAACMQRAQYALDADDEFRAFWDLMTLAIRPIKQDTSNEPMSKKNCTHWIVHEAVAMSCPPLFVRFAAALHPEQLQQREGKYGRLPLHLAAVAEYPSLLDASDPETNIQVLIQLYPDAALCEDYNGKLPIHLALESGKLWDESMQDMFMAWPSSLSIEDRTSCLVPFMLAAVGKKADINTIYSLLCEGPCEVNRCANRCAKS